MRKEQFAFISEVPKSLVMSGNFLWFVKQSELKKGEFWLKVLKRWTSRVFF